MKIGLIETRPKTDNERYERDGKQEMAQLLQGHQYKSLGCSCCSSIFLGIWGHIEAPEVNLLQTIFREVSWYNNSWECHVNSLRNATKKRHERDGKQEMAQLLHGHQYKSLSCSCCSSIFLGIWGHIEAPEVNLLRTISCEVSWYNNSWECNVNSLAAVRNLYPRRRNIQELVCSYCCFQYSYSVPIISL